VPHQLGRAGADRPRKVSPRRGRFAADGSDANSGLVASAPIRTLQRAHAVLVAAQPTIDVEVRIKRGTYVAPPTRWTFLVPGHTVSFMPADYRVGGALDDIAGRPVFRGNGKSGFWLTATLPPGHRGDAGLRFYYLRVERYDRGGLQISGGTTPVHGQLRPKTAGHNGNVVMGMYFTELGSRWAGKGSGYGGVDLVNSRGNKILYNQFVKLENRGAKADLIHGIYLAHHSSGNRVQANKFITISGDPVRIRNDSNDNDIFDNTLHGTGQGAQYSDWFCNLRCARDSDRPAECASHGNLFHDNSTTSGYRGRGVVDWSVMSASGEHKDCADSHARRVRTWHNR
jgi:hypothetical protein